MSAYQSRQRANAEALPGNVIDDAIDDTVDGVMLENQSRRVILEIEDFSFTYPGQSLAVFHHLNWIVSERAFVVLTGDTGSGKSTLLRCLKPELAPEGKFDGTVSLEDKPLSVMSSLESAGLIGFVAQNPQTQVVCETVEHEMAFGLENLAMEPALMRRRIAEVVSFFGIAELFHRSVNELSGGQLQLVNLASVLCMQPRLLLLDEPTAQLDPVATKDFCALLFRVNRELGITAVVATHDPENFADYATECVHLSEGTLSPASLEPYRHHRVFLPEPAGYFQKELLLNKNNGNGELENTWSKTCEAKNCKAESRGQENHKQENGASSPRERSRKRRPLFLKTSRRGNVVLNAHDLWFRYDAETPWVFRSLDFSVEEGVVHGIVGGNGSGKSTLLRLLAGTRKPDHGKLTNGLGDHQAFLPQHPEVLFTADTVREELQEYERCGVLSEIEGRFGLEGLVERNPLDLSGGQRQLVALAKVLASHPKLLLLDEPAKGLDPMAKFRVALALKQTNLAGATVVLVAHDLAFAAVVCDTITMLFDGEAACTEPTDEFFRGNMFYRPFEDGFTRLLVERKL